MRIIANNISTRNAQVARVCQQVEATGWSPQEPAVSMLKTLAEQCIAKGADALEINLQQHYDRPEIMEFAVNAVQQVSDVQLCLSSNNPEALETGLNACKNAPMVNYVSIDKAKLQEILPLVSRHEAEIILLVSDPSKPGDARELLQTSAVLIGAANQGGIPSNRIIIDPGVYHVTTEMGQRHLAEVIEFLRAIPDAVEPEVRSTCWLGNVSAGAPEQLRPVIDTTFLAVAWTLGLSSVFLDVLSRENMRAVRLLRIMNNELVYSDSEMEL